MMRAVIVTAVERDVELIAALLALGEVYAAFNSAYVSLKGRSLDGATFVCHVISYGTTPTANVMEAACVIASLLARDV